MRTPSRKQLDFKSIRESNKLYIDKTRYIYKLANDYEDNYFFISRPSQFGKSLTCSTLKYLFQGRKELFDGLYIATSTDYPFEEYPVIHIDFSAMNVESYDSFVRDFQSILEEYGKTYGIELEKYAPSSMLDVLLARLDNNAVIIIDEFDYPIISNLKNKWLCDKISGVLNDFYRVIKANTGIVRFCFITGITNMSEYIFSTMNNVMDITDHPDYAGMFGFTEDEIETYFKKDIEHYITQTETEYNDKQSLIKAMRDYYGGYRFSPYSELNVYNPLSVNSFFKNDCRFKNYWNMTGIPTLVIELARKYDLISIVNRHSEVGMSTFSYFDISKLVDWNLGEEDIVILLYYLGYLTIKDSTEYSLVLGEPNKEISTSFKSLLAGKH